MLAGKVLFQMELDRTEGLSSTVSDVGVTPLFTFISGSLTAMFLIGLEPFTFGTGSPWIFRIVYRG